MKFKPTDKFFIVKRGKVHQAVVIEVTETKGMPKKLGTNNFETTNRVYYAIMNSVTDGKPNFSRHHLSKHDVIFSSYLKAIRFLKENVVYLHDSDIETLINEERNIEELPF